MRCELQVLINNCSSLNKHVYLLKFNKNSFVFRLWFTLFLQWDICSKQVLSILRSGKSSGHQMPMYDVLLASSSEQDIPLGGGNQTEIMEVSVVI